VRLFAIRRTDHHRAAGGQAVNPPAVGVRDADREVPVVVLVADLDEQAVGALLEADLGPRRSHVGALRQEGAVHPDLHPIVGAHCQQDLAIVRRLEVRGGIRHVIGIAREGLTQVHLAL